MQKIKILIIGKIRNKNLFNEINQLKKRINRLEIIELKEIKDKNIEIIQKKEFEIIKSHIKNSNYNILLTENGFEYTTLDFYKKLKNIEKEIIFIISGPYGSNNELKKLVNLNLSLSKMIFTHEQALYLLVEQLYRSQCYNKNIPYTK